MNIQVKPGETLAIVGATGAGKSTIINLVSRFYEIQKGQILLDGQLHTEYELNALREQMAVVLQEVFLFSDTIHYNVTLGDDISMEKLEEAARLIGVQELIEKLPGGWQFNVRERGGTLSAGQRQLISFCGPMCTIPRSSFWTRRLHPSIRIRKNSFRELQKN